MWNDLAIELKSDSRLTFNIFVKKIKKSFDINNKYEGVFVRSCSELIFIFMW